MCPSNRINQVVKQPVTKLVHDDSFITIKSTLSNRPKSNFVSCPSASLGDDDAIFGTRLVDLHKQKYMHTKLIKKCAITIDTSTIL
jgi:hypothetical protein